MAEQRRKFRFRWLLLQLAVLLIVAEVALRFFWTPPKLVVDNTLPRPFYQVVEKVENARVYRTNGAPAPDGRPEDEPVPYDPSKLAPIQFTVPASPEVLRIFLVGSSPIYGGPGEQPFNLSSHLRAYLETARPDLRFEILNAASQQLSAQAIAEILEQVQHFDPDFTLVYVGGAVPTLDAPGAREVTESHPVLYKLVSALDRLYLLQAAGFSFGNAANAVQALFQAKDDEHTREAHLVKNVLAMTERELGQAYEKVAGAAAKAPGNIAFYEVVTDLAGSPPLWSVHFKKLSKDELAAFDKALAEAETHLNQMHYHDALAAAEAALAIDDTYALAHYRRGLALAGLSRYDQAYHALDQAREQDASHDRLFSAPKKQLFDSLEKYDLKRLPAEAAFLRAAEHGLPGKDLFRDITHPNSYGLSVLGRLGAVWVLDNLPESMAGEEKPLPSAKVMTQILYERTGGDIKPVTADGPLPPPPPPDPSP